jgi:hypothetical protein
MMTKYRGNGIHLRQFTNWSDPENKNSYKDIEHIFVVNPKDDKFWNIENIHKGLTNADGNNDPKAAIDPKVIPFADDGGGNSWCFDYRKSNTNPSIVWHFHEAFADKSLEFRAKNFEEFLVNTDYLD